MANVDVDVSGLQEVINNLRKVSPDNIAFRRGILASLAAGGRVVRTQAAANARGIPNLASQGVFDREDGRGTIRRYGRLPRALKVGKSFVKADTNSARVRVYSKAGKGLARDRAPHAHLKEYGFKHWRGPRVAGTPYLHPALRAREQDALNAMYAALGRAFARLTFAQGVKRGAVV